MVSVFVYGTLQSAKVLQVLLGSRAPTLGNGRMVPAVLHGYRRFAIKDCVFPAIVSAASAESVVQSGAAAPAENVSVQGLLLTGLTEPELDVFDAFEDEDYTKERLTVELKQNAQSKQDAFVYVWKEEAKHLLYDEWDLDHFLATHEEEYLVGVTQFKQQGGWQED